MKGFFRLLAPLLLLSGAAGAVAADQPRLEVQGNASLLLRLGSVSGGSEAYSREYWDTAPFEHQAQVTVSGPILDRLYFQGQVNTGRFSRSTSDFTLRFDAGASDVLLGSVSVDTGSNPFISLQRQLKGMLIKGNSGGGKVEYSSFA